MLPEWLYQGALVRDKGGVTFSIIYVAFTAETGLPLRVRLSRIREEIPLRTFLAGYTPVLDDDEPFVTPLVTSSPAPLVVSSPVIVASAATPPRPLPKKTIAPGRSRRQFDLFEG